jgi:hypothetical protein
MRGPRMHARVALTPVRYTPVSILPSKLVEAIFELLPKMITAPPQSSGGHFDGIDHIQRRLSCTKKTTVFVLNATANLHHLLQDN